MIPHSNWLGKQKVRGAEFRVLATWGLRPGVLKVDGHGRGECWELGGGGIEQLLDRKQSKQLADTQHGKRDLKSIWDTQWGGFLLFSNCIPERRHSQRDPSRNKGTSRHRFPPLPLRVSTGHLWEPVQCPHWLPNLLTPSPAPLHSREPPLPLTLAPLPAQQAPNPRRAVQPPAHTTSFNPGVLQGLGSDGGGNRFHLISRPEHIHLKVATFRPGTKHCPQQAKRASAHDWLER